MVRDGGGPGAAAGQRQGVLWPRTVDMSRGWRIQLLPSLNCAGLGGSGLTVSGC